jgi:hypothetical protein
LIRCYFHHVHFFLPVVDAAPFLDEYIHNGRQTISLVLFWSMLLAAANVGNGFTNSHLPSPPKRPTNIVFQSSSNRIFYVKRGLHLGKPWRQQCIVVLRLESPWCRFSSLIIV